MVRNRTRTSVYLPLLAVLTAFVCFAATATTALGRPGDSIANATVLNEYWGSSLTTMLVGGSIAPTGHYYLRVQLTAGNTLRANFKPGVGVVNLKALVLPFKSNYRMVESYSFPSGTARLTFMAPVSGMYNVYFGTSSLGTFTVSPTRITPYTYPLSGFLAPTKVRRMRSLPLSVKVTPGYDGPLPPVTYRVLRKVSGHWRYYRTVSSRFGAGSSTFTRFTGSTKLSRAGYYRVRAQFRDAAHPRTRYTSYKTIRVY